MSPTGDRPDPGAPSGRSTAAMLAAFLALSIATTWPLVLDPAGVLVTRHFDGFAAIWLMDVAPDLSAGLFSDQAGWPHGQILRRADSQILVLLARLLRPLLGPVLLFNLVSLLGPVVSAWAAERFARVVLGARRPWSLIAGLSWSFCGLSATSVLEGHAYFLLVPWLPLMAEAWWRATGPEARVRDGVAAGIFWTLSLLTSGYMGVLATLVVLWWAPRALRSLPSGLRPLGAAAAVALPLGLAYAAFFATGADPGAQFHTDGPALGSAADAGIGATAAQLQSGSSGLLQLVTVRLADDEARHGIAPILSVTAMVLALLAGRVLPRGGAWRSLQALGLVGLALSLGPLLELVEGPLSALPALEQLLMGRPEPGRVGGGPPWPGYPSLPWLLFPLAMRGGDVFIHFPYRFAWLAALGFGAVGAAVATALARDARGTRRVLAYGLLAAAFVDAGVRPLLPHRAATVPMDVPAAYGALAGGEGGVLELWPRPAGGATDADLRMNNLTCTYQRVHQRPMVSDCIGTGLDRSPRVRLTRWVLAAALREDPDAAGIRSELAGLGVGAVVVHPLLFGAADSARVEALLERALGAPLARSTDGGDPVVIYGVDAPADRAAAVEAWAALGAAGW